MSLDDILQNVREEVREARQKHAPMHSFHEGYAVILEELDELWVEIKNIRNMILTRCARKLTSWPPWR